MALLSAGLIHTLQAQVTIGSGVKPDENALLDLKETDAGTATKGLLLPRVALEQTTSPKPLSTHVAGMTVYNTVTANDVTPGYYYNDGAKWIKLGSGGSGAAGPWKKSGTNNAATLNTDSIYSMGAVTIGSSQAPDASAIFDVIAKDKGVLLPRITLTDPTDTITIPTPTEGLLVYNTGNHANFNIEGYMYWDGGKWRLFNSSPAVVPNITNLYCNMATLSPSVYYANKPYRGTLKIPYTSNGGGYYGQSNTFTNNGLSFTLPEGKLENGGGELVFTVAGTPIVGSPQGTLVLINYAAMGINIPFWNGSCFTTVGTRIEAEVRSNATMGNFTYTSQSESGRAGYEFVITTPDGRFSIRAFIPDGEEFAETNLQFRSNSGNVVIASVESTSYQGGTTSNSRNQMPTIAGRWGGGGNNASAGNGTTFVQQSSSNFPSWGNEAVYFSNAPEYRVYSFTPISGSDKVFYKISFMMSIEDPTPTTAVANSTTCPGGVCNKTKAFFMIEQIAAP
jgi:hypothetical protein